MTVMAATVESYRSMVAAIGYKPGWSFRVGGPLNRYLCVHTVTPDSNRPTARRGTQHMFELPGLEGAPFYRWVFERLLDCEYHETGEFFRVGDARPFMPNHEDEGSPYARVEREIQWP